MGFLFPVSEELPLRRRSLHSCDRSMTLIGLSVRGIKGRSRESYRSIERIKSAAFHLGHDPLKADTNDESGEAPEKAANGGCDEGTFVGLS